MNFIWNVICSYILLKVQSGEYAINENLQSEKVYSLKFNCSKSVIHNTFLELRRLNVLFSIPSKCWKIEDWKSNKNSVLNNEIFDRDAQSTETFLFEKWINECEENKVFWDDYCQDKFNNLNNFYCYKKIYNNSSHKREIVFEYLLNFHDNNTKEAVNNIENHNHSFIKITTGNKIAIYRRRRILLCLKNKDNVFRLHKFNLILDHELKPVAIIKKIYYENDIKKFYYEK